MSKKISKIIIIAFIALLLVPSAGMLIFGASKAAANEIQAPLPKALNENGAINWDFLSGLCDWFDDRFFLRGKLSGAWAGINASLFKSSVEDDVIAGKNGWLYYAKSANDYQGVLLSDAEIEKAAENLLAVQNYCEENGMKFLFCVAPNKNSLYPENMPSRYIRGEGSNAKLLYGKLDEKGVNYANLHDVFSGCGEVLYLKTDSHWNSRGAALAADAVLNGLGMDVCYYGGDFSREYFKTGDLYEMLYPEGEKAEPDYTLNTEFSFKEETNARGGDAINFKTSCGKGFGKAFIWRDSFGNSLYPYLAESFSEASFSRADTYDLNKLSAGDYDTVIIEIVERNISRLAE